MSYYDPWFHVLQVFCNRVLLFLAVSLALSAALWCWLLKHFYGAELPAALKAAWAIVQGGTAPAWPVQLGLTVATGVFATTTVFAVLLLGPGRLRQGEQHRRGARVVGADERVA
ncbi:MAG: hypothetical protein ACREO8_08550 [Luteimonas sp.]